MSAKTCKTRLGARMRNSTFYLDFHSERWWWAQNLHLYLHLQSRVEVVSKANILVLQLQVSFFSLAWKVLLSIAKPTFLRFANTRNQFLTSAHLLAWMSMKTFAKYLLCKRERRIWVFVSLRGTHNESTARVRRNWDWKWSFDIRKLYFVDVMCDSVDCDAISQTLDNSTDSRRNFPNYCWDLLIRSPGTHAKSVITFIAWIHL